MNKLNNIIFNKIFAIMMIINIIVVVIGEVLYNPIMYFVLTLMVSLTLVLGCNKDKSIKLTKILVNTILMCLLINAMVITMMIDLDNVINIWRIVLISMVYPSLILIILGAEEYLKKEPWKYVIKVDIVTVLLFTIINIVLISVMNFIQVLGLEIFNEHIIRLICSVIIFTIPYMNVINRRSKSYKKEGVILIVMLIFVMLVSIPGLILRPKGEVISITSCAQLSDITRTGKYSIDKDIDCEGEEISNKILFNGSIQGNGYKISNMEIEESLMNKVGKNGEVKNIIVDNYEGSSIIKENYGSINQVVVSNSTIQGDQGVGIVGENYGEIEKVKVQGSEIKGNEKVGAVVGENEGSVDNVEIREDVLIYGGAMVGSVVGKNEGTINHAYSSGNVYGYDGGTNYGEYTGMVVGEQVDGASTKHTVYSGDTYIESTDIISGTNPEYQQDVEETNVCIKEEYAKNNDMREVEYNYLLGTGRLIDYKDYDEDKVPRYEEEDFGKCDGKEPTNEQRRVSYLGQDEYNVVDIGEGEGAEQILEAQEKYSFLKDESIYSEEKMGFPIESEKVGLPPMPLSYGASFLIWETHAGYDMWHVEKATEINYAQSKKTFNIKVDLFGEGGLSLSFDGNIWEWDDELGAATLKEF